MKSRFGAVLAAVATVVSVATAVPSGTQAAVPAGVRTAVDVGNWQAVRDFYVTYYRDAPRPAPGWTGSIAGCNPGMLSADSLDATLQRHIYFRNLAGSPTSSTLSAEYNMQAQSAALMLAANPSQGLTHDVLPSTHPNCWSQAGPAGQTGAGTGNLGWSSRPDLLDNPYGWVDDRYNMTANVGHRYWELSPNKQVTGFGMVGNYTAHTFDSLVLQPWSITTRHSGFLSWPTCGSGAASAAYNPWATAPIIFSTDRWGAGFTNATISAKRNGSVIAVTRLANEGWPGIAFKLSALPRPASDGNPATADSDLYEYTISNITGAPVTTYTCFARVLDINQAPSELLLSSSSIYENRPVGTLVANLYGTDPDGSETLTYSLVSGCADNAEFSISGNTLSAAASFDYETKSSYSVCIRVSDGRDNGAAVFTRTISVVDVNEAPSTPVLADTVVDENTAAGTAVGTITSIDPDAGDVVTFTESSVYFEISGNKLVRSSTPLNFETTPSVQVTITARDKAGLSATQTYTITVRDVNEAPTNLTLSATVVDENVAVGSVVGTLATTDPDNGATHTYTLAPGSVFAVRGNQLVTAAPIDYEKATSHPVTITTTDNGGLQLTKTFIISVRDVYEAPSSPTNPPTPPAIDVTPLPDAAGTLFRGESPRRLADTRESFPRPRLAPGEVLELQVNTTFAVSLNLTAVAADGPGHLAAYPCAGGLTATSNLNFFAGETTANMVVVQPDADGRLCIAVSPTASVDVVVDQAGTFDTSAGFVPRSPDRLLDTRRQAGKVPAGTAVAITGLTPNVAHVFNLTVTQPDADGHLTAYPCAANRPNASNSNFVVNQTRARLAVVAADGNGEVCIYTLSKTHLVVDTFGSIERNAAFGAPVRVLDSRTGFGGYGPGTNFAVQFPEARGRAVILNVTATAPRAAGHVTASPCGQAVPNASMLNYAFGQTVPNAIAIQPDSTGRVCFSSHVRTQLVVDFGGYLNRG